MSKLVTLLNGPNLNLLGLRQPEIYGRETLEDVAAKTADLAEELGLRLKALQSNHEGQLVDWIQQARGTSAGIIINPGAYSHTSVAIADALRSVELPVVEVHLSNVHAREEYRRHSFVSEVADVVIAGAGPAGYEYAVRHFAATLS